MPAKKEVKKESPEKVAFKKFIEQYKEQNPAKYEAKKAELDAKLKAL